ADRRYLHSFPTRRSSDLDLFPCIIHLGGSVEDGVERARQEIRKNSGMDVSAVADAWIDPAQRIVSLLLYMCSAADYQHRGTDARSEEHTSELQSRENLVC